MIHIISSASIFQLESWFSFELFSPIRIKRNLKIKISLHHFHVSNILLHHDDYIFIKEIPQKIVSVYSVYRILQVYPIWTKAFEPLRKLFPAPACALAFLIIIKNSSKKTCPFKDYFKSTSTIKY